MEVLRLENLSKYYTSENSVVMGLTGITLSFSTGEFVAITGESGSGKSTLAHVLGGILPYESGELYIYGNPTSHYDADDRARYRRDMISFISQSYGILPGNTVFENVESALLFSGLTPNEARSRTDAILADVELSELKKRKAGKLSSGQKQRLSIARALAKSSKILIADEPTGNLDRENSDKIMKLLKRASRDRLVILITHEFEEAKDIATRRIVLADGTVVTDAMISQNIRNESDPTPVEESVPDLPEKKKRLVPYVAALTARSRPIFVTALAILLAATTFITFVFLGTFIIATDDSPTRIYDTEAFYNGARNRIVIMRFDGEPLTEEDYDTIISRKYAESIERLGYVNDYIYHYRAEEDYEIHDTIVFAPDYHPLTNPGAYSKEKVVEFSDNDLKFVRTVPYTGSNEISEGRAPEGAYEVVSADPDYGIGDEVTVYIRNKNLWNPSRSLKFTVKVVGTSNAGTGLYFSDKFAAMITTDVTPHLSYNETHPWPTSYIFAPYAEGMFSLDSSTPEDYTFGEGEFIISNMNERPNIDIGMKMALPYPDGTMERLVCSAKHNESFYSLIIVSNDVFDSIISTESDQVSLYIKDYAYTDRVIDSLVEDGYIAVSPYQLGSVTVDEDLANERMLTLVICAAIFLISFILQSIMLRSMFSSLHEHYRLMSNTGLTPDPAYRSCGLLVLIMSLVGELIGGASIVLLNLSGYDRVVNIFKYLDTGTLLLLLLIHFLTVLLSLISIVRGLKRSVFCGKKNGDDINFELMEDAV